jgi:predicted DNA-binding transcriptional regulator AlpA
MTYLTRKDIAQRFGVALRTVTDKWTKRPDFPQPAERISRKTVRWLADDVDRWARAGQR